MSIYNKVVWSEGLFLQPHHFQQQDRFLERYVETRCESLVPYSWGFSEVELEPDLLSIGKLGLRRAMGVFPDGTPFRLPEDGPLPAQLEIGSDMRDQLVHLAVPLRRPGAIDVDRNADDGDGLARLAVQEVEAQDVASSAFTHNVVQWCAATRAAM